jgi:hypothetical protein
MIELWNRMGFWSAAIIAVLVILIDVGMMISAVLYPMSEISSIEDYAGSFNSLQMLPFIPSLLLAPFFVILMLCIHHDVADDKKI